MIILWTRSLQKQFDAADPPVPITAISLHPGVIFTRWTENVPQPLRWIIGLVILGPVQGSYGPLFAAASKQVAANKDNYKGVYLQAVGKIGKLDKAVVDDERVKQLWDTTERFLQSVDL
jgi:hypothetical protein